MRDKLVEINEVDAGIESDSKLPEGQVSTRDLQTPFWRLDRETNIRLLIWLCKQSLLESMRSIVPLGIGLWFAGSRLSMQMLLNVVCVGGFFSGLRDQWGADYRAVYILIVSTLSGCLGGALGGWIVGLANALQCMAICSKNDKTWGWRSAFGELAALTLGIGILFLQSGEGIDYLHEWAFATLFSASVSLIDRWILRQPWNNSIRSVDKEAAKHFWGALGRMGELWTIALTLGTMWALDKKEPTILDQALGIGLVHFLALGLCSKTAFVGESYLLLALAGVIALVFSIIGGLAWGGAILVQPTISVLWKANPPRIPALIHALLFIYTPLTIYFIWGLHSWKITMVFSCLIEYCLIIGFLIFDPPEAQVEPTSALPIPLSPTQKKALEYAQGKQIHLGHTHLVPSSHHPPTGQELKLIRPTH